MSNIRSTRVPPRVRRRVVEDPHSFGDYNVDPEGRTIHGRRSSTRKLSSQSRQNNPPFGVAVGRVRWEVHPVFISDTDRIEG